MLTSKDILERTGISRATLNNYIASGLVARPEVLPPGPQDGDAPRIGYFPEDTIERIATIQRLKQEGWSIGRIAEYFTKPASARQPAPQAPHPEPSASAAAARPLPMPQRQRPPVLTRVAVLVATLHDATGLWLRLPAEAYFELVSEVWVTVDPILRARGGVLGRHPDEGLVAYFLPRADAGYAWNAITAAAETRQAMRDLSGRWRAARAWDLELRMNVGIDEGEEWMGVTAAGELRVLGEAAERAEHIARCCRPGAITVSRRLLAKVPAEDRRRLLFGAPDRAGGGHVENTFMRLGELAAPAPVLPRMADVAVAEIVHVQAGSDEPPAADAAH